VREELHSLLPAGLWEAVGQVQKVPRTSGCSALLGAVRGEEGHQELAGNLLAEDGTVLMGQEAGTDQGGEQQSREPAQRTRCMISPCKHSTTAAGRGGGHTVGC
jgi:hypothetical protein